MGLGIGCLVLVIIGAVVIGVGSYYVYEMGKEIQADLENREQAAKKILKTEALPSGFVVHQAFKIPLLMEMVIFKKDAPDVQVRDEMPDSGMFYMNIINFGNSQKMEDAEAYFRGETTDSQVLRDAGINIDTGTVLANGVLESNGATYLYSTHIGRFDIQGKTRTAETLACFVMIKCPDSERMRVLYWFDQESIVVEEGAEPVLEGTGKPGDEQRLREIVDSMNFCGN